VGGDHERQQEGRCIVHGRQKHSVIGSAPFRIPLEALLGGYPTPMD
jgi:hypothetical protein